MVYQCNNCGTVLGDYEFVFTRRKIWCRPCIDELEKQEEGLADP